MVLCILFAIKKKLDMTTWKNFTILRVDTLKTVYEKMYLLIV